jgi:6-hydroxycyclohex-1-ene-1-carbonyl-CoA dehydrogenase
MSNQGYRWLMTAVGAPMVKESFEIAAPGAGEVVVKVAGCGVCHTDLGFLYDGVRTNQPLPLTLGHDRTRLRVADGSSGYCPSSHALRRMRYL